MSVGGGGGALLPDSARRENPLRVLVGGEAGGAGGAGGAKGADDGGGGGGGGATEAAAGGGGGGRDELDELDLWCDNDCRATGSAEGVGSLNASGCEVEGNGGGGGGGGGVGDEPFTLDAPGIGGANDGVEGGTAGGAASVEEEDGTGGADGIKEEVCFNLGDPPGTGGGGAEGECDLAANAASTADAAEEVNDDLAGRVPGIGGATGGAGGATGGTPKCCFTAMPGTGGGTGGADAGAGVLIPGGLGGRIPGIGGGATGTAVGGLGIVGLGAGGRTPGTGGADAAGGGGSGDETCRNCGIFGIPGATDGGLLGTLVAADGLEGATGARWEIAAEIESLWLAPVSTPPPRCRSFGIPAANNPAS
jgi:hypothetical protein